MRPHRLALLLVLSALIAPDHALAAWPAEGLQLVPGGGARFNITVVPDGSHGYYATWQDSRHGAPGTAPDVWLVAISPEGTYRPGWPVGGVLVHAQPGSQDGVGLVRSEPGGVIIAWQDVSVDPGDLYLQKLSATGEVAPSWPIGGVPVAVLPGAQFIVRMAADAAGGAYMAWRDDATFPYRVVLHHVLGSGTLDPLWPAGGLKLPLPIVGEDPWPHATFFDVAPDGAGGVFIAWDVSRHVDGFPDSSDIRLQRFTPGGSPAPGWPDLGLLVRRAPLPRNMESMFLSEDGHVYVLWVDGGPSDIYHSRLFAQKVSLSGTLAPGWPAGGLVICGADWFQGSLVACTDGVGGVVAAWYDQRAYDYAQIYAVRFLASGERAPGWPENGKLVSSPLTWGLSPTIAPDLAGGAYIGWHTESYRGYVQHVMGDGAVAPGWQPYGYALPVESGSQQYLRLVSDELGGAYVLWEDNRFGENVDVYAMRLAGDGPVAARLALVSAEASPDQVRLRWQGESVVGPVTLERREEAGAWQPLASLAADGTGAYHYEDRAITAGTRYAYRLAWGMPLSHTEETWVTVPLELALSLEGARPNPARGAMQVAFTLPDEAPATLELLDVAGRRVLTREVGARGAGRHLVRLERAPTPGLYWLRLTHGGRTLTARAVVMD